MTAKKKIAIGVNTMLSIKEMVGKKYANNAEKLLSDLKLIRKRYLLSKGKMKPLIVP